MVKKINTGSKTSYDIKKFFAAYPYKTQQECAKYLGIHYVTVCRHIKLLRAEAEGK